MLFMTYWELNEEMAVGERQEIAKKLTDAGLFPPENVEVLRWDATPDGWGVLICEAESASDVARALNVWRVAGKGFFKTTRTAPAVPVREAIADTAELLEALGAPIGAA